MKIFKDVISGDEVGSDSYPITVVDDLYYELEGKVGVHDSCGRAARRRRSPVARHAQMVTVRNGIDDALIGANASAEADVEDAGADDGATSGINIVLAHRLVETQFDKKSYTAYIRAYMKRIKEHLERTNVCTAAAATWAPYRACTDAQRSAAHAIAVVPARLCCRSGQPGRVEAFTRGMPDVVKKILGNFDNYQFYTGESMNVDGLVLLLNFREDGVTPYFIIFKDGITEEKVVRKRPGRHGCGCAVMLWSDAAVMPAFTAAPLTMPRPRTVTETTSALCRRPPRLSGTWCSWRDRCSLRVCHGCFP